MTAAIVLLFWCTLMVTLCISIPRLMPSGGLRMLPPPPTMPPPPFLRRPPLVTVEFPSGRISILCRCPYCGIVSREPERCASCGAPR